MQKCGLRDTNGTCYLQFGELNLQLFLEQYATKEKHFDEDKAALFVIVFVRARVRKTSRSRPVMNWKTDVGQFNYRGDECGCRLTGGGRVRK